VKWLASVDARTEPFDGWQQTEAYRIDGEPVTRMLPRALLVPPGIPDFLTRGRFVPAGVHRLAGRAWSGWAPIDRVEVSDDGGETWSDAELDRPLGEHAWRGWHYDWEARAGPHELCCRASDEAGNVQPTTATSNEGGYCNNAVQRVGVTVTL
jgi:hypothetical protein